MTTIALYIPVLHEGYRLLLGEHKDAEELIIFDRQLISQLPKLEYIKKDIRAIEADLVAQAIEAWGFDFKISVIKNIDEWENFKELNKENNQEWILSHDDFGHFLAEEVLVDQEVKFSPIFLRWDKNLILTEQDPEPTKKISFQDFEQEIMSQAFAEASRSSNWWRQVGTVIIRDGQVVLATHNKHLPTEDEQYFSGDVRSLFKSGQMIELTSSVHAEALAIARAARAGIKLEGADIFVTTFPCPVCAKQIAMTGIKRLFYATGYAVLDGQKVMEAAGIEIIEVQFSPEEKKILVQQETSLSHIKKCYD